MEFTFTTEYDHRTLTVLARSLRKTTRAGRSRITHILGWAVVVLGFLLTLPWGGLAFFHIGIREVVTWLALLFVLTVLLWEDHINGWLAAKRMMPGLHSSTVTFYPEHYHSVTEVGESDFHYENITALAESEDYFILIFGKNHAQLYDKASLSGGSTADFSSFIREKTGKTMAKI